MLKFLIPFRGVVYYGKTQILINEILNVEHTSPCGDRTNSNPSSVDLANWWAVIAGPDIGNWYRLPDDIGVDQDTFGSTLAGGSLVWSVVLHLRPQGARATASRWVIVSLIRRDVNDQSPTHRRPAHPRTSLFALHAYCSRPVNVAQQ